MLRETVSACNDYDSRISVRLRVRHVPSVSQVLLRGVGIPTVLHTTPHGRIVELDLRPANAALLSNENVSIIAKEEDRQ